MSKADFFTLKEKIIATDLLISSYNNFKANYNKKINEFTNLQNQFDNLQKNHQQTLVEILTLNQTISTTNSMLEAYQSKYMESELKGKALESHNTQLQEKIKYFELKDRSGVSEVNEWKSKYTKSIAAEKILKKQLSQALEKVKKLNLDIILIGNKAILQDKLSKKEKELIIQYKKQINKLDLSDDIKNELTCQEKNPYEELKVDITGPPSCVSVDSGVSLEYSKCSPSSTPSLDGSDSPRVISYSDSYFITEPIRNKLYEEKSTNTPTIKYESVAVNSDLSGNDLDELLNIQKSMIQKAEDDISDLEIANIMNAIRLPKLISPIPFNKLDDEPQNTSNISKIRKIKSKPNISCKKLRLKKQSSKYMKCLKYLKHEMYANRKQLTRKIFYLEKKMKNIQETCLNQTSKIPDSENGIIAPKVNYDISNSLKSLNPNQTLNINENIDKKSETNKNSILKDIFGEISDCESDHESKKCTPRKRAIRTDDDCINHNIKRINLEPDTSDCIIIEDKIETPKLSKTRSSLPNIENTTVATKNKKNNPNVKYKLLRKGAINKNIESSQRITISNKESLLVAKSLLENIQIKSGSVENKCLIPNTETQLVDHVSEVKTIIEHNSAVMPDMQKQVKSIQTNIDPKRPILKKRISHFGKNIQSTIDNNTTSEDNIKKILSKNVPSCPTTYNIKTRRMMLKNNDIKNIDAISDDSSQKLKSKNCTIACNTSVDSSIKDSIEKSDIKVDTINEIKFDPSVTHNIDTSAVIVSSPSSRQIIEYGDTFSESPNAIIENPLRSIIQNQRNKNTKKTVNPSRVAEVTTVTKILIKYLKSDVTLERINELLNAIQNYDEIVMANAIVSFLIEERNSPMNTVNIPLMPTLTYSHQTCLCFVKKLNDSQPPQYKRGIYNIVMECIQFKLFSLTDTPLTVEIYYTLAKFYATICHVTKQTDRLRIFCADALYSLTFGAIPVISAVLEIWPFLLPKSHFNTGNDPLVVVLVHLMLTVSNKDQSKEYDLKSLLFKYGFKSGDYSNDFILNHLLCAMKDTCNLNKSLTIAFIIFGKRCGTEWCHKNILINSLLPMLDDDTLSCTTKSFAIRLIGPLMRPFPVNMTLQCEVIIKKLTHMLRNGATSIIEEALIYSLSVLSRKKYVYIVQEILKWNPKAPVSDELITIFERLAEERNGKFLKTNFLH